MPFTYRAKPRLFAFADGSSVVTEAVRALVANVEIEGSVARKFQEDVLSTRLRVATAGIGMKSFARQIVECSARKILEDNGRVASIRCRNR